MSDRTRVVGLIAIAVCLSLLVGTDAVSAADGQATGSAGTLEQANLVFEQEEYVEAIRLYEDADENSGGTSYDALMGLARSHYRLGRLGEAARYAFDAMELGGSEENRAEACILIGHTYLDPVTFEDQVPGTEMLVPERERNLELAAGFFRQAMQYASEASPDAWIHLAQAFEMGGEGDAAAHLYEAYLEQEPEGEHAAEALESLERLEGSQD